MANGYTIPYIFSLFHVFSNIKPRCFLLGHERHPWENKQQLTSLMAVRWLYKMQNHCESRSFYSKQKTSDSYLIKLAPKQLEITAKTVSKAKPFESEKHPNFTIWLVAKKSLPLTWWKVFTSLTNVSEFGTKIKLVLLSSGGKQFQISNWIMGGANGS